MQGDDRRREVAVDAEVAGGRARAGEVGEEGRGEVCELDGLGESVMTLGRSRGEGRAQGR